MALTRRFFTSFARDLKEARPAGGEDTGTIAYAVWMHCVTITANHFALNNAMFNRAKFYEACGMPQEAIDRVAG